MGVAQTEWDANKKQNKTLENKTKYSKLYPAPDERKVKNYPIYAIYRPHINKIQVRFSCPEAHVLISEKKTKLSNYIQLLLKER